MTPTEVRTIVDAELRNGLDENAPLANPHRVQLERSLLRIPESRTYKNSFSRLPIQLWLIL